MVLLLLSGLSPSLSALQEVPSLADLKEKTDQVVQETTESASDTVSATMEEVRSELPSAGQEIGNSTPLERAVEAISGTAAQASDGAKEVVGKIGSIATNAVTQVKNAAEEVLESTGVPVTEDGRITGESPEDIHSKGTESVTNAAEILAAPVTDPSKSDSAPNAEIPSNPTTQDGSLSPSGNSESLSIDQKINDFIGPMTDAFEAIVFWPIRIEKEDRFHLAWVDGGLTVKVPFNLETKFPFVLIWLLGAGIWSTLYFGFPNLRLFGLAIRTVRGKYSDSSSAGEVSHFKALTTALSATVGLGNIAGVAVAVTIGGPGATLWMILAGIIGMSSKFVECTLGVKFRQIDENGKVHGGPMYYLSQGFRKMGLGEIGTLLGGIFALMCIGGAMGGGNIFQINSATQQIINFTVNQDMLTQDFWDGNRWMIGAGFALVVGLVIIGGLVWIATVTSFVVPFMCGLYVLAALLVIIVNIGDVPGAVVSIFKGAFSPNPEVVTGGIIGALIAGFQRAAFSNEAGIGSAPIAHSGVKTNHPASEGVVALLEPFIDTVVVCTMTALVIIIALGEPPYVDANGNPLTGITLTTAAFKKNFEWMGSVLTLSAVLFAFSTMISWCYYGMQSWTFLFGKSRFSGLIYKFIFLAFVVIGSSMSLDKVTAFSDAMIFAMAFPNVFAIVLFSPMVRQELRQYLKFVWDKESAHEAQDENIPQ